MSNRSEQANTLARQYVEHPDDKISLTLWTLLRPVVLAEARRFLRVCADTGGLELDDLVQGTAWIALTGALERFDPDYVVPASEDEEEHASGFTQYFVYRLRSEFQRASGPIRSYERDALQQTSTASLDAPLGNEADAAPLSAVVPADDHEIDDVVDRVFTQELHAELERAMRADLSPAERAVIAGRYYGGLTSVEISEGRGVPVDAVRRCEARGFSKLRADRRSAGRLHEYLAEISPYSGTGLQAFNCSQESSVERAAILRETAFERVASSVQVS